MVRLKWSRVELEVHILVVLAFCGVAITFSSNAAGLQCASAELALQCGLSWEGVGCLQVPLISGSSVWLEWHAPCNSVSKGGVKVTELRRHPFIGEWVILCPESVRLPNQGVGDGCRYCSSNELDSGGDSRSPDDEADGKGTWVPKVVTASPPLFNIDLEIEKRPAGICDTMKPAGIHEIVIDSPHHDVPFEDLPDEVVYNLLDRLRCRLDELRHDERLRHTLIFKVQGKVAKNRSHPCWQIVGTPFIPTAIKQELKNARYYYSYKERCVLCDYLKEEIAAGKRLVFANDAIAAIAPFASRFPYEVWLLPKRHCADFSHAQVDEIEALGSSLKTILKAISSLDGIHGYIVSIHSAPYRRGSKDAWKTLEVDYHWHIEARPEIDPLNGLGASGGFKLNPISPEKAAHDLRNHIASLA